MTEMMGTTSLGAGSVAPETLQTGPAASEAMQGTVTSLARMSLAAGYVVCILVMFAHEPQPRWDLYLAPALAVVAGAAALASLGNYRHRAGLLLALVCGCIVAANLATGRPELRSLYCFVVLLAGVLLGGWFSVLVGALASGVILLRPMAMDGAATVTLHLALIWASVWLSWAAVGNIYGFLRRAELDELRAWNSASEARRSRGELRSVVRSLEEAMYRIERINSELLVARREADVARAHKTRFVATVSHELRGPLNLILGFSRLMALSPERYGEPLPNVYRADVATIYRNSRHLCDLVDDILDLSQIEAERLPLVKDRADLGNEVIQPAVEIVRPLAERKGLALTLQQVGDLPFVLADKVRLRQVVLNLLTNAVRFADRGEIVVRTERQADRVLVSVRDSGLGIDPEQLPKLFQEFTQAQATERREAGGTGLGLAISKQLVELHGGQIWVESARGIGSTFFFTVPLPGADSTLGKPVRTGPSGYQRSASRPCCLVVHENPNAARLLARYLEGYRVIGLPAAEHVASLVEEHHPMAIITTPKLASDIRLLLSECPYDVPLITCGMQARSSPAWADGVLGYLIKPIAPETLCAAVRGACSEERLTVLVVDDDPDAARLVESMLTPQPYCGRVLRAYSGEQALMVMAEIIPDVVLMDVVMPGLDGLQTVARMRSDQRLAQVPVVLISARDAGEDAGMLAMPLTVSRRAPLGIVAGAKCIASLLESVRADYLMEPGLAPQPSATLPR